MFLFNIFERLLVILWFLVQEGRSAVIEHNKEYIDHHQETHQNVFGDRRVLQSSLPWKPLRILFDYYDSTQQKSQIDKVLSIAQSFFSTHFLVQRENSPNLFSQSGQIYCFQDVVPKTLYNKQYDADMVFFITFDPNSPYLASAGPCAFNQNTMRPIFGQIGIGGAFPLDEKVSNVQFEKNTETVIHEMIHGLGFTDSLYGMYYDSGTGKSYTKSNFVKNNILYLSTPRVLNYTRFYFGCSTADGVPMENEGGAGTANAHWERRLFFNEIMTGSDMAGDFIFSMFTFKLLEDSGWYRLQQIDPDAMHFGYRRGCDFLNKGCMGGIYPEFCTGQQQGCSSGSTGYGGCGYDNLADGCQMIRIYSNFDCRDATNVGSLMDFQYNSVCFKGSFFQTGSQSEYSNSCHAIQCSSDNNTLKFTIDGQLFNCSENNQVITSNKFAGNIICPNSINQQCQERNECESQCSQNGYCLHGKCYCIKGYSGKSCENSCIQYRYQSQCLTSCPQNTFPETFSMYCVGCPNGCSLCSSVGSCQICREGYILLNGWCERDFTTILTTESVVMQERDNLTAIIESVFILGNLIRIMSIGLVFLIQYFL